MIRNMASLYPSYTPLQYIDRIFNTIVLPFQEVHIRGFIQHIFLYDWSLSLGKNAFELHPGCLCSLFFLLMSGINGMAIPQFTYPFVY